MNKRQAILLSAALGLSLGLAQAQEVKLTPEKEYVEVIHKGKLIKVGRIQNQDHTLTGSFAKTSRKCPPFCIQPIVPVPGVTPVGEVEVFAFMERQLLDNAGVLIDARTPAWHKRGTIPGSVNIPFTVFEKGKDDAELVEVMTRLGGHRRGEVNVAVRSIEKLGFMDGDLKNDNWDFSNAKDLLLWCNGPWCGQSPRAIRALVELGYPPEKIYYYRGGMQAWQILGLTTIAGE
jgi:rhodanese-related sulfurtransferase